MANTPKKDYQPNDDKDIFNPKEDKLDIIFKMQASLNEYIIKSRNLPPVDRDTWLTRHLTAMMSEIGEFLNEINFKWWKNPKPVNEQAVKEELTDILHFFVSMCLNCGMTADELFNIYLSKNQENYNRQNGISQKKGYSLNE